LHLQVTEREASGSIHGAQALSDLISIRTETLAVLSSPRRWRHDSSLAKGNETIVPGLTGKLVKSWRIKQHPNGQQTSEFLAQDHYRATPTLVVRRRTWPVALLCELGRIARI
jgi:hypothetical protein